MEEEQWTAGRCKEYPVGQREKCVSSQTATVTVEDRIRQVKQEEGCCDVIRQRNDNEPLPVKNNTPLESVALMDKFQDMKDVIESVIVKEEGLQECLENCVLEEGLHFSSEGLNQHPVLQNCEEECGISAGETEEKDTQPKSAESDLDIKNSQYKNKTEADLQDLRARLILCGICASHLLQAALESAAKLE
ncbi:oocyte zinc finger protein XlCOF6-like [Arapaima gigas]